MTNKNKWKIQKSDIYIHKIVIFINILLYNKSIHALVRT